MFIKSLIKQVVMLKVQINRLKEKMKKPDEEMNRLKSQKLHQETMIMKQGKEGKKVERSAKLLGDTLGEMEKLNKHIMRISKEILKKQKKLLPLEKKLTKHGVSLPI